MTTVAELIHDTRDHLLTGESERINKLQSNIDNSQDTITLTTPPEGIRQGTIISVGLEEMTTLSVAGQVVTVIRATNGSTAAAASAGDIVRVSPKFSDWRIFRRLNNTMEDLVMDGLFRIKPLEFTFVPSVSAYNLNASDLIDIWRIRFNMPGPTQYWQDIRKGDWELDQDANLTDFPNGKALILYRGGYAGHLVRVSYKATFGLFTATSNDVLVTSGLHVEAHKIPPLGAALYLLGGRDVKRTFLSRQPEPRRSDEVPPGAATQSTRLLLQEYLQGIRRERRRLRRRYPEQV